MIFLAEKGLLFLKPRKTAGTSVELALSANAGPSDIVTPLAFDSEVLRLAIGGHFPGNWAWLRAFEHRHRARFEEALLAGGPERRAMRRKPSRLFSKSHARFYNHVTPRGMIRRGAGDLLRRAHVVTIVRHPYELLVSYASHLAQGEGGGGGETSPFIDLALRRPALDLPFLFGPRAPDTVLRHEHLLSDLAALECRFDLRLVDRLPEANGSYRTDRRPAAEILTPAQKRRCQTVYARTFATYGYQA